MIIPSHELSVTCTCSSLVYNNWYGTSYGNCEANYLNAPICYVNQPSNCADKVYSISAGAYYSWEACGKYHLEV